MTPDKWKKVKQVLDAALESPEESRSAVVSRFCGADLEFRREVESLLEHAEPSSDFLDSAPFSDLIDAAAANSFIGRRFGNYVITEEIGSGGMGTVFLAKRADGAFEQRVAIKFIKAGVNDAQLYQRFINERRILAALEHPNISRLIDGGTTEHGVPYFVMEFSDGVPLVEYAAKRNLSIADRLRLFQLICEAVSYAHRNLVVHRDLKPSNILVDNDGVPKLLDFGIAKFLSEDYTNQTKTRHPAFTPEYASPEQICGENLTTSTDVYSLGVILFELLSGRRPHNFENKSFGEMIKTAMEEETPKLSQAALKPETSAEIDPVPARLLRGDLDVIVQHALQRKPERRYATVDQFSADIQRYLRGMPISARPDSLFYRAQKFVTRNPLPVAAAVIFFLVMICGTLVVNRERRIAETERAKAERRFSDIRSLANSFMFEINDEIKASPIKARELLVSRALEYLDKLSLESENDLELTAELATAYEKIGSIQAEIFRPTLGNSRGALESHRKALALRRWILEKRPNERSAVLGVISSLVQTGSLSTVVGDLESSETHYSEATRLSQQLADAFPDDSEIASTLGRSLAMYGQTKLRMGDLEGALENYEKAFAITNSILDRNPEDRLAKRRLGIYLSYSGYALLEMKRLDEALENFQRSLAINKELLESAPNDSEARRDLSIARHWFAVAKSEVGDYHFALETLRDLEKESIQVWENDRKDWGNLNGLADVRLELGTALAASGDHKNAVKTFLRAVENYEDVAELDHENHAVRRQIALTKARMADSMVKTGSAKAALAEYKSALRSFEILNQIDPANAEWSNDVARTRLRIGQLMLSSGDRINAAASFNIAKPIYVSLRMRSPGNKRIKKESDELELSIERV